MQNFNKDEYKKYLRKYSQANGPSGMEDEVRDLLIEDLKPYADRIWIDSMGNVISLKKGVSGKKLMIAAHMDEISLIVKYIDDNGFLRFSPVGGWNERILPATRVKVRTNKGDWIPGVIGVKPPHLITPEEEKKVIEMNKLFIDVGASSRQEALSMGIEHGSRVLLDYDFADLIGNRVTGKAFDDRAGLVVALKTFMEVEPNDIDLYFVATVQEEVGLKGARTSAYQISPDVAIALDVTTANDVPDVDEQDQVAKLGKGPAIKIIDGRSGSGLITNTAVLEKMISVAKERGIPYQAEVLTGGTTDSSAIQLTKEGVPAGTISIPARYIHSPVEVIDLVDIHYSVELLKAFYESLKPEWIDSIKEKIIK
ncbi:M42 family metallopeptidase [Fervidicoccus fontis]|uniref:M42 family peptidase n=1 Tax=Fervidicoccus fontis TaxID=683846 RepID=A0A2J6N482_9CREN|nr:M42 family metallopeptidase [Fervidicoccus fontis]PMB76046.1 MAG: peptidase M42 [Fervidicoccus fontis]HEW63667.1 M42 family peptidase [Fervidicoccus fontis]